MTPSSPDIAARLSAVRKRIDAARFSGTGREARLIAIGKTFEAATLREALIAGQRAFGENRVQEAARKWPGLKADYPDCELHLVGPLQTNKAEQAVDLFDVIHVVDRPRLAHALERAMARRGRRPDCLVQVNIGEEAQKSGVAPADLDAFLAFLRRETALPIVGLTAVPPLGVAPEPYFSRLAEMARAHRLTELSMGMSGDFETAVAHGATMVRVGTAIFGVRAAGANASQI